MEGSLTPRSCEPRCVAGGIFDLPFPSSCLAQKKKRSPLGRDQRLWAVRNVCSALRRREAASTRPGCAGVPSPGGKANTSDSSRPPERIRPSAAHRRSSDIAERGGHSCDNNSDAGRFCQGNGCPFRCLFTQACPHCCAFGIPSAPERRIGISPSAGAPRRAPAWRACPHPARRRRRCLLRGGGW